MTEGTKEKQPLPTTQRVPFPLSAFPLLAFACLAILWWILISHLRVEWSVNAQYAYGWAVPFLVAYLLWLRWENRDSAAVENSNLSTQPSTLSATILAVLLLPILVIEQANPEWRLISWGLAGVVVGITLLLILRSFGSLTLRHFAFPICFFLVSVPWPTVLEHPIIQGLTRGNIAFTLELLGLAGIPALQQGNLIEISTGVVGVDEACSGIRSLQATLMISLFFGEMFRLNWMRRIVLCVIGFLLAFIFNIGRTFLLVWVASRDGIAAIDKWHDPAGVSILLGCFCGLWLAAWGLKKFMVGLTPPHRPNPSGTTKQSSNRPFQPFSFPAFQLFLFAWLIFCLVATEFWYRWRESGLPRNAQWSIQWPESNKGFRDIPIAEAAERMLRFNEGRNASWMDGDGKRWQMFYARWDPGATAVHLAKSHTPEVCLTAIGQKIQFTSDLKTMPVHGLELPYRVYVYEVQGRPVHVFYSLWEDRAVKQEFKTERMTLDNRLGPVWEGRRNRGQRSLLTAVWGAENIESAEAVWQEQLNKVMVVKRD